jgi:hypothetical protein
LDASRLTAIPKTHHEAKKTFHIHFISGASTSAPIIFAPGKISFYASLSDGFLQQALQAAVPILKLKS